MFYHVPSSLETMEDLLLLFENKYFFFQFLFLLGWISKGYKVSASLTLLDVLQLIDWFLVINVTFSNISAISWRPVLVVEEARVPGENHRPWASNW
jgi:hypothetical protein